MVEMKPKNDGVEEYDVNILDLIYCENPNGCRNNNLCSVCKSTYKRVYEALHQAKETARNEERQKHLPVIFALNQEIEALQKRNRELVQQIGSLSFLKDELEATLERLKK